MIPLLVLAHALLAVVALMSAGAETEGRSRFLRGLAVCGALLGLILFFATPLLGDEWRTIELAPSLTRISAIAVTAAWVLAAATEGSTETGRWDVAALTGVASTALILFATNQWLVPALLFAGIATLCIALLLEARSLARVVVSLAGLVLGGTFVWLALAEDTWALLMPAPDAQLWVGVVAAAGFALVPVLQPPNLRTALPVTPLALGLAFAVLATVARGAGPVLSLVFIVGGLVAAARVLLKSDASQRMVLIWTVVVTVGLGALSSNLYVTTRAGIAGILGASVVALWPLSLGRAQIERGILIAFVAVTAGFNAVAAAAAYAFDQGTSIEAVVEAGPWAAIAAVLPITLAAGVALGASVGRNPEPEDFNPPGVLASWALVVLTIVVGIFPFVDTSGTDSTRGVVLYVLAVVAGLAATRYVPALAAGGEAVEETRRFAPVALKERWPKATELASLVCGGAAALVVIGLTFYGLRLGFL